MATWHEPRTHALYAVMLTRVAADAMRWNKDEDGASYRGDRAGVSLENQACAAARLR